MTDEQKAELYIRENVCNKERVLGSQSVCSDKAIRECNEYGNFCYFAEINRKSFLDGLSEGRNEAEETMREKFQKGEITILGRTCKQWYELLDKKHELEKENVQLKAQIEKMKCCGNCKHYVDDNCDLQCPHNCYNYDEWELKE